MDNVTTSTSSPSSASEAGSENSKNWRAVAIPSIDGSKLTLNVMGEVRSGIVPLKLTRRENKENLPANVVLLDLTGVGGGPFAQVTYQEDITGQKLDFVLVFNPSYEIEAAIKIEKVMA